MAKKEEKKKKKKLATVAEEIEKDFEQGVENTIDNIREAKAGLDFEERALTKEQFESLIESYLAHTYHSSLENATADEIYKAVASVVNGQLNVRRRDFNTYRWTIRDIENNNPGVYKDNFYRKKIYYISMEFLMGQSLKNNLFNLGETELVEEILEERGLSIEELYNCEPDAGLGSGGLGRLAACYLDALTSCGYDVTGYSLRYEYGIFKQKLIDGWQAEMPDNWLPGGGIWLNARPEDTFKVGFYGHYHEYQDEDGFHTYISDQEVVEAVPYDIMISGYNQNAVGKLRLWRAKNSEGFDMKSFNSGDFTRAAQQANRAELITKVLYPADNIQEGKELRLKQQYFMVSASCQNIVRDYVRRYGSLDKIHERIAIQINDTHPALCVPELMRIFIDDYGMEWDDAWERVKGCIYYTNHTVLSEALERWNKDIIRNMLPRIYAIIKEIDRRFRAEMGLLFPGDFGKINYMAPVAGDEVRMANLSIVGSSKVNGVSSLHSEILKNDLFHDFYLAYPDHFSNVTNGITYRRWLCQSNPQLSGLIEDCIGPDFKDDPAELENFKNFADDSAVKEQLAKIKRANKVRLSEKIAERGTLTPDPDSVFIVQAKRLHEYKRQLLNVLRIISRYQALLDNPDLDVRPETYLFAAKAAPSYYHAKYIIQLIWSIGKEIEKNPRISEKLRVVFLEDYSVSLAETLMPAAEISEQISLAGKEASGTGNMKLMVNGALTIGTMDGANVEMYEAVGEDNIFIFGQRADEVEANIRNGYCARGIYDTNEKLRRVIDSLDYGFNGTSFSNIKEYLLNSTYSIADPYMCLYDFDDYCRVHDILQTEYEDRELWNKKSIINIAGSARFGSDRCAREYADNIWHARPIIEK